MTETRQSAFEVWAARPEASWNCILINPYIRIRREGLRTFHQVMPDSDCRTKCAACVSKPAIIRCVWEPCSQRKRGLSGGLRRFQDSCRQPGGKDGPGRLRRPGQ